MAQPLEFRIHGMDCADEVAILRREIIPLVGSPERLGFDILRGKMLIADGSPVVTSDQIADVGGENRARARQTLLELLEKPHEESLFRTGEVPL